MSSHQNPVFTEKLSGDKANWNKFNNSWLAVVFAVAIPGLPFGLAGYVLSPADFANLPGQVAANVPFVPQTAPVQIADLDNTTPTNRAANRAERDAHIRAMDAFVRIGQLLSILKSLFFEALTEEAKVIATNNAPTGILYCDLRDMYARVKAHCSSLTSAELTLALAPLSAPFVEGTPMIDYLLTHQKGHAVQLQYNGQQFSNFDKIRMASGGLVNHHVYALEIEHYHRSIPERTQQTWTNFSAMLMQAAGRLETSTRQMDNLSRFANAASAHRTIPARETVAKRAGHAVDNDSVDNDPLYCYSHGIGATHTSKKCENPCVSHDSDATATDKRGGNTRTWANTPRDSKYRTKARKAGKGKGTK